ncbi:MAG: protein translocase subunit SecD [Treponema sp.]|nr:protein translocase subunit SecD [Treponema sp.]
MKKRYRFIIVLAVMAVCFVFLWPTLRWYFLVPREQKALAMETRQEIRNNAEKAATVEYNVLLELAKTGGEMPEKYSYLIEEAKKILKNDNKTLPEKWDAYATLNAFPGRNYVMSLIEAKYRDEVLSLKELQKNAVQLGLDLLGGMSIVLQAKITSESETERDNVMASALEELNRRIDRFGLTEPTIRQQGTDQIYVEIPGNADPERINSIIMGKGSLNFHIVDAEETEKFYNYYRTNKAFPFDENGNIYPDIVSPGIKVLGVYRKDQYDLDEPDEYADGTRKYLALKEEVGLSGTYIDKAVVSRDNIDGKPEVTFRLLDEGADIFYNLTAANIKKDLAIVLDDRIKASATIQSAISANVRLTGFGLEEANNIALVLQTALPVELEVLNQQSIGASMGEDTIRQGMYALLGGVVAVLVFMLFYYKIFGINAIVAQLLNFYMMFSILSAFNFTLTLPSIAGFILTIGMAVDASVIIFERMKEEMRIGKPRKAVIEAGFDKAFWAIMDSNITTFIAALFLSQLGSGPIQGFAVTLAVGVFSSVFTALFVSRLIFDFSTDVFHSKKVSVTWAKIRIQSENAGGNK